MNCPYFEALRSAQGDSHSVGTSQDLLLHLLLGHCEARSAAAISAEGGNRWIATQQEEADHPRRCRCWCSSSLLLPAPYAAVRRWAGF